MHPALRVVAELATLVWRAPDGLTRQGATDALRQNWRRIYSEDMPAEPSATVMFFPGGRVVYIAKGKPLEIRKLPGERGVGPSALELTFEKGKGALDELLGSLFGEPPKTPPAKTP